MLQSTSLIRSRRNGTGQYFSPGFRMKTPTRRASIAAATFAAIAMTATLPRSSPSPAAGFTLLEVMVVVVIIGIVVTFAMISFNVLGGDREAEQEARRVVAILSQVRDEAAMQGRDFGMRLEPTSYEFLTLEPRRGGWQAVTDDDLLRSRQLPDGLRMRLWLESREIILERIDTMGRAALSDDSPRALLARPRLP